MPNHPSYGLEQARINLPLIIANAHSGLASVITRHGKPYAAVVPIAVLEKARGALPAASSLLALRGTGQGLWGESAGQAVAEMREEWGDDPGTHVGNPVRRPHPR